MLLLSQTLLSLLNGVPTLFQTLPTPATSLVDRTESRVPPTITFSHKGLNADEYVFARRWGHWSRPICFVDASNGQYIINSSNGSATTTSGDWRSDEKAIELLAASTDVAILFYIGGSRP